MPLTASYNTFCGMLLLKGAISEKLSNFSYVFCKLFRKISRKLILPEEAKTMRNFVRNFAKNSRIFRFFLRTDCEKMRNFPETIFPFRIRPFSPCKDGIVRLHFTSVMYVSMFIIKKLIICDCVFLYENYLRISTTKMNKFIISKKSFEIFFYILMR